MGGLQAKSMTSQRSAYKMADMRYYGNVMTTRRWLLYVTMETSWQQQDGGYALLWRRYPNDVSSVTHAGCMRDIYNKFSHRLSLL